MDYRARILAVTLSAAALAGPAWAGSLEPPPGAVTPTMKTLDEVEARQPIHQTDLPLTIIADGSYYLAESLWANQNGVDMITVLATTVAIDLNGFTIHGTSELAQAADGIQLAPSVRSFSLSNGFIRGCAGDAATGAGDTTVTVTNVHVTANNEGLVFGGGNTVALISQCVAKSNTGRGFVLTKGVVESSMAIANGGFGIQVVSGLVRGCVSKDNSMTNLTAMAGGVVADTYAP